MVSNKNPILFIIHTHNCVSMYVWHLCNFSVAVYITCSLYQFYCDAPLWGLLSIRLTFCEKVCISEFLLSSHWETFNHYVYFFSALLLNCIHMYVWYHLTCILRIYLFLHSFPLCSSHWIIYIVLSFNFTCSFLWHLHSDMKFTFWILKFQVIYFIVLEFLLNSFFSHF